jgi:hypothetical protein
MRVLCIHGHEGVLEEGETYTVKEVTKAGNYLLTEVDPPQPFASFKNKRFVPLPEITEDELIEMEEDFGGDQDWV